MNDHSLSVQQVSERLGVSAAFIWRRLRVDPFFPKGFMLGKLRRWSAGDIDAYVEGQKRKLAPLISTAEQPN